VGDTLPKIRLAAVQAAPVFLDREASTAKACRLIREAGVNGANVVGFPEGFIPTHPLWYHFMSSSSPRARQFATELFLNAVEIPSPTTDLLCQAAREAGVYVVMGLCERVPGTTGTMYNSQLFLNPAGRVIGSRRKIMPTLAERIVHALGSGDGLRPVDTEYGPISGLICGENSNPLAVFAQQAMGARIHVASWPSHFSENQSMLSAIEISTRALAYSNCVFVINAVGLISDEMIEAMATSEADRRFMEDHRQHVGGASIINPLGLFVAGPMGPGEGMLYADVDLTDIVRRKTVHDFAGHYNRADVFTLILNDTSPTLFRTARAATGALDSHRAAELLQTDSQHPGLEHHPLPQLPGP
jgi:aliphatic nitrilase